MNGIKLGENRKGHNTVDNDRPNEFTKDFRLLEKDHEPEGWPAIQMRDISQLCDLVENAVPAIDLLQKRLEQGQRIKQIHNRWAIEDEYGEPLFMSNSLRELMMNLIWIDC